MAEFLIGESHPQSRNRISLFELTTEKTEKIKEKLQNTVTTIGEGKSHTKGMGVSNEQVKQSEIFRAGIGCVNGIILTPRGLYGVAQLPISSEFPQGQVVTPLEQIADIEIKAGDKLKDILRQSIIIDPVSNIGKQKSAFSSNVKTLKDEDGKIYNEHVNIWKGVFRKQVDIKTKTKLYRAWYDEDGEIQSAWEVDAEKEAKIKEESQRHHRAIKESSKKAVEESSEKKETQPVETWEEKEKRNRELNRELFISLGINDAIKKAVEDGRIDIKDKHLTDVDVRTLLRSIMRADMLQVNPYRLSFFEGTNKPDSWRFMGGWDFIPDAGFIKLEVYCQKDSDEVNLDIVSERYWKEVREENRKKEEEIISTRVAEAIKDGNFEFLSNYMDEEKQKIMQAILGSKHSFQDINVKKYHVDYTEVDVPDVGKVRIGLSEELMFSGKYSSRLCIL